MNKGEYKQVVPSWTSSMKHNTSDTTEKSYIIRSKRHQGMMINNMHHFDRDDKNRLLAATQDNNLRRRLWAEFR